MAHRCDDIISFLAANVSPERLADRLRRENLIGDDIKERASTTTIAKSDRIRPMVDAVISRVKLNVAKHAKFISVLKQFQDLEDLIQFIEKPL